MKNGISIFPYRFGKGSGEPTSCYAPENSYIHLKEIFVNHDISYRWTEVVPAEHRLLAETDETGNKPGTIKNQRAVVETVTRLAEKVALNIIRHDRFPLTFGGDHTQGLGTSKGLIFGKTVRALMSGELPFAPSVTAAQQAAIRGRLTLAIQHKQMAQLSYMITQLLQEGQIEQLQLDQFLSRFFVLWFDAHGDYNTHETTLSGNAHGMAAAAINGIGSPALTSIIGNWAKLPAANMHFIAVRDLDPEEYVLMVQKGVYIHDMEEIQHFGLNTIIKNITRQATEQSIKAHGKPPFFHLSFDIDGIDARYVPGTGTPVGIGSSRNSAPGPTLEETVAAFSGIAYKLAALDISEANFRIDRDPTSITLKTVLTMIECLFKLPEEEESEIIEKMMLLCASS